MQRHNGMNFTKAVHPIVHNSFRRLVSSCPVSASSITHTCGTILYSSLSNGCFLVFMNLDFLDNQFTVTVFFNLFRNKFF